MSRITGRSLLVAFDGEVQQREAARSWIESQIAAEEKKISAANSVREAAYAELSELYAADNGRLAASFGDVSQRLQAIFDEKMQRRATVNALLQQAAGLIGNLQSQLPPAQQTEQSAQQRLEETRRTVEAELGQDQVFLGIKGEAEAGQVTAKLVDAAHARIRAECETKLAVFHAHRLFRYLVSVKFGTPNYQGGGVTAAGDRWVARLVAWERNYPAFATLSELPAFAEKRVAEARKRAELAATKVAFHVNEREVAHQVDLARTSLAAATEALKQLHAQITKLEDQRAALVTELESIDAGTDLFQKRAKAEMKAFLTGNSIAELRAKAIQTPDGHDNELVGQIEQAEATINDGRRRVKSLVAERATADEQHRRAITARRKFSSDYTGTYDQFSPGTDISDLLTGYIIGSTSERVLWSRVDHHHHDATPTYSYSSSSSSGGSSWAGSDSSSWGGSSSSGGDSSSFSSGGGDSGGSFSTGGGD